MSLGFPGAFVLMTLGGFARPVLAPLVLRTTPISLPVRVVLVAGLVGGIVAAFRVNRR